MSKRLYLLNAAVEQGEVKVAAINEKTGRLNTEKAPTTGYDFPRLPESVKRKVLAATSDKRLLLVQMPDRLVEKFEGDPRVRSLDFESAQKAGEEMVPGFKLDDWVTGEELA